MVALVCRATRLFQVVCVLDIMHLDHVDVVQPQALQRLCYAAPPAASESEHVHTHTSDSGPNLGSISLTSSPFTLGKSAWLTSWQRTRGNAKVQWTV